MACSLHIPFQCSGGKPYLHVGNAVGPFGAAHRPVGTRTTSAILKLAREVHACSSGSSTSERQIAEEVVLNPWHMQSAGWDMDVSRYCQFCPYCLNGKSNIATYLIFMNFANISSPTSSAPSWCQVFRFTHYWTLLGNETSPDFPH